MNSLRSGDVIDQHDVEDRADATILARIAHDDTDAIGVLIRRYVRPVTLFAEQLVGDRDDAEDVAEETFLIVMRQANIFDPRRGEFQSWLYAIARGVARRHNARRHRRRRLWDHWGHETRVDPGPARVTEARDMLGHVARVLDDLPDMQRQCFELHVVRGLEVEDVATMFDVTEATVRQHVFRARRVIRARLRPTEEV